MKFKFAMPPTGRRMALALGLLALGAAGGLTLTGESAAQTAAKPAGASSGPTESVILAGGCFWCVESDFDKVPGVLETVSGYAGGQTPNPTYRQVSAGGTGHFEVVKVTYDPAKVSYGQLISYFWRTVDPVDAGGQFCDRGESYKTAIFALTPEQAGQAEASKAKAEKVLGKAIVTPVITLDPKGFTSAEDYHQDYHNTNSLKYKYYRYACGRDARLTELWGDAAGKWPPPTDAPQS
ncbi:peptide methionine sulfoxide reductase MsrA [Skermanella stibiiresistens SB22]|uniref:Peptide methionine sulfoxide reductase MsrA n=1 Tax=Skermanella stibiiresistens SB22 TaxID=1385369 RepID=W9HAX1_9PROT|nr:peptide-methionine (S)-S-oxide reductase MsrA [Skermanella stibiiresistens]EWY41008.1 peptide methionine sulfoxide reductase MsrA [Skermanella stibiiresistens SB22]